MATGNADRTVGVAYFYCDGNYAEKQDHQLIFGCLVRQLLSPKRHDHPIFIHLKTLPTRSQKPHLAILLDAFQIISTELYESVYIIIDGLDECRNRKLLLDSLVKLSVTKAVNIITTSRAEENIIRVFVGMPTVAMDIECVQQDITLYVDDMLSGHDNFKSMKPEFKRELKDTLLLKSCGMYWKLYN